ncbi:MAG: hypothetical protein NC916_02940, partial [Candidatus Omnitrophica bacterium]|nr:hypothetical protein [Candidatus Omnitrophota bacterium]
MSNLKGLATGIGSLPHKDADEALDLIFKYFPAIPFWPQLPNRDIREGMVAQFSENLPCLKITSHGLTYEPQNKEREWEDFYEKICKGRLKPVLDVIKRSARSCHIELTNLIIPTFNDSK